MKKMMKTAIALALIAALWAGHLAGMAPGEEVMAAPKKAAVPEAAQPALAAEAVWQAEALPEAAAPKVQEIRETPILRPEGETVTKENYLTPEEPEDVIVEEEITVQGWLSGQRPLLRVPAEESGEEVTEARRELGIPEDAPAEDVLEEHPGYSTDGWISGQEPLAPAPAEESEIMPLEDPGMELDEENKNPGYSVEGWLSGQAPITQIPDGETVGKGAFTGDVSVEDPGMALLEMP